MGSPEQQGSLRSTVLKAMLAVTAGAVVLLAAVSVWFTQHLTDQFNAARVRETLERIEQRVRQLADDAVRLNGYAQRQIDTARPFGPQFEPLMNGLNDVFELHRDISYVGIASEATGEYSMLQRQMGTGPTRNREYRLKPDGSRAILDYEPRLQGRALLQERTWDGYDPRQRPFYLTARTVNRPVWTEAYPFWQGNERGSVPGITYAAPIRDTAGTLVGMVDVDFDLESLCKFVAKVARGSAERSFIVERRADGSTVVVAHPDPAQLLLPVRGEAGTNAATKLDPILSEIFGSRAAAAGLDDADALEHTVKVGRERFYWSARSFNQPEMPRWTLVTVLPAAAAARETHPVHLSLGCAAAVLILVAALVAGAAARRIAGPIARLEAEIGRQIGDDETRALPVTGSSEVRRLAEAFNRLAARIGLRQEQLVQANARLSGEITRRLDAEGAMAESTDKFTKAFHHSPIPILITELETGRVIDVNSACEALSGYARDEVVGRTTPELGIWTEQAGRDQWKAQLKTRGVARDAEMRFRCKDGHEVDVLLSVVVLRLGSRDHAMSMVVDITSRKRAAEELARHRDDLERQVTARTAELMQTNRTLAAEMVERQKGEEQIRIFRRFADAAGQGLAMASLDGRITYMNRSLLSMLEAEEWVPESAETVFDVHAPESADRIRNEALRGIFHEGVWSGELELLTRSGRTVPTLQNLFLVRDGQDRPKFLGAVVTDLTAQKRTEDELRAANDRLTEVDRLKSEFLATMSHELRTPLNSIIGFTGILRQKLAGPLNPEQEKQLGMVQGSARHLLGLINDLLDLSRVESGKMDVHYSEFPVAALVEEVVRTLQPMAGGKNLPLRVDVAGVETIRSDRKKVFQILLNLANNAVKFTDQGEVHLAVAVTATEARFTVTDTGIGIREEHQGRLFEAFRQIDGSAKRVYEGTGLGLYLCRQLVTLLGGSIGARSVFGQGSAFSFTVPNRSSVPPA